MMIDRSRTIILFSTVGDATRVNERVQRRAVLNTILLVSCAPESRLFSPSSTNVPFVLAMTDFLEEMQTLCSIFQESIKQPVSPDQRGARMDPVDRQKMR